MPKTTSIKSCIYSSLITRILAASSGAIVCRGRCAVLIGTVRSNDADGKENVKKTIGFISKTTTLHVITLFCTILCLFLHDYDVKMPNFVFYRVRKQATTKFHFSFPTWIWSLGIPFQEGSPTFDIVSG